MDGRGAAGPGSDAAGSGLGADPVTRVVDEWTSGTAGAEVHGAYLRRVWPALADALDAMAAGNTIVARDRESAVVVAAMVQQYGVRHPDRPGVSRVTLPWEVLVEADAGVGDLTAMTDQAGNLHLRHRQRLPESPIVGA